MGNHSEGAWPGQAGSWRASLPRTGPGPYAVADGRVLSDGLEVVITTHCNLRCRACAYLSPVMPVTAIAPEQIQRDLAVLARSYHACEVRVLGGEPLLHPELVPILQVIRASGISDTVRVITNGVLLTRAPASFWELADEVSVSVYPGREPGTDVLAAVARTADEYGVRLRLKYFHYFRESYSEPGARDPELTERIFRTCQMANVWRCNTVLGGRLYRCPQSAFLPSVIPKPGADDGLALTDDPGFGQRLLAFLESSDPLGACTNCLGSVGRLFGHSQMRRSAWRTRQQQHTEELLDWEHLRELERNPGLLVRDTSFLPAPVG